MKYLLNMDQMIKELSLSRKTFILALICLGTIYMTSPSISGLADYFTFNLSNNNGYSINQKLLQSNGFTYVVWTDTSNSANGSGNIFFRSSNDSGISFTNTIILSNKTGDSNLPDISSYGNNVYVTWEDESLRNSHIYFRSSSNNGATFGQILDISNDTVWSTLATVASNKNYVYVVWVGSNADDPNNFEVFLRRSNDSGQSFGPVFDLSKSDGDSIDPHIMVPTKSNNVYLAYTDCDPKHDDPVCRVYFIKSTNHGLTFDSPLLISTIPLQDPYIPTVKDFQPRIFSSLLFTSAISVQNKTGEHNSVIPLIESSEDGKYVYIMWEDDLTSTGASDIFFRRSIDFGKSFDDAINISNTPGISRLAQAITLGSDIYLVWSDTNTTIGQFDLFFKKIGENGKQLGKTINLSNSNGISAPSDIGLDYNSRKIYVAWAEKSENQSTILLATSVDSGNTFEEPLRVAARNSLSPSLIQISYNDVSGLVWTEYGRENADIYFARIR
jgi:hypothetical protein